MTTTYDALMPVSDLVGRLVQVAPDAKVVLGVVLPGGHGRRTWCTVTAVHDDVLETGHAVEIIGTPLPGETLPGGAKGGGQP